MTAHKVKTVQELGTIASSLKKEGKKVVLCHGVFDLLHPGHLHYFEEAKKRGDVLMVTVTPDRFVKKGPGRPVFNQRLRLNALGTLETIDFVALNEWETAVQTIALLKPDIYAKGPDYADLSHDVTGRIVEEKKAVEEIHGQLIFTEGETYSSTELLNNFFNVYPEEAQLFLREFRSRYNSETVLNRLSELYPLKALVIGEAIIDEYIYCHPMNKAPKDNILVSSYLEEEHFAGGVLACANHLAAFCQEVHLLTSLGEEDSREEFVRSHLQPNVRPRFFKGKGKTIVKRRFVEPKYIRKMFEICYLGGPVLADSVESDLEDCLMKTLDQYDLVLVVDYGHGFFRPNLVSLLAKKAPFLAVNTQTNSANYGFNLITKYPRADFACLAEPEIRLAGQDRDGPLDSVIRRISDKLQGSFVAVTRGPLGSMTYDPKGDQASIPIFSTEVIDRIGAGDTYLALASAAMAKRFPVELVGFLGNVAAALAVRVVGNRESTDLVSLKKFITALLK